MKIYICRHSKTEWNNKHLLQGWKDSPLLPSGIEDAKALHNRIQNIKIDYCFSSPIQRACKTAQILFPEEIITYDDRLKEMNFGKYEGRSVKELLKQQDYYDLWNRPEKEVGLPGGETYQEVYDRVQSFLFDLYRNHENDTVFLVIHGMLFVVLRGIMENLEIKDFYKINTVARGCSLTEVDYDGTNFTIHKFNDCDHLSDEEVLNYTK